MAITPTCITSSCWKKSWRKSERPGNCFPSFARRKRCPDNVPLEDALPTTNEQLPDSHCTMKRVDIPELLDSDACSPEDVQASLRDISRINRWFGGAATSQKLIEEVARVTGLRHFSLL